MKDDRDWNALLDRVRAIERWRDSPRLRIAADPLGGPSGLVWGSALALSQGQANDLDDIGGLSGTFFGIGHAATGGHLGGVEYSIASDGTFGGTSSPGWVYYEEITLTATTTAYTVAEVYEQESMILVLNGLVLRPADDFTISGTTITFTTAPLGTGETTNSNACYIARGRIIG